MYILQILYSIWETLVNFVTVCTFVIRYSRGTSFRFLQLARKIPGPSLWQLLTVHSRYFLNEKLPEHMCTVSLGYNNKPWKMWGGLCLIVVVSDPETIGDALKSQYLTDKDEIFYESLNDVVGKNSLSINGSEWKLRRKINTSALSKPLKTFGVIYEEAEKLTKKLKEYVVGEDVDIYHCVEHAIICSSLRALGGECVIAEGNLSVDEVSELAGFLLMEVRMKAMNPIYYYFRRLFNNSKEMAEKFQKLVQYCRQEIRDRREAFRRNVNKSPESALEVFAMNQKDHLLSEEEIIPEMLALVVGAFDTTSTVITATILLLALHPHIQQRVAEEIESVFDRSGRPTVPEDLPRLEYLERVIKESMRLFPPGPLLLRKATEEVNLNGTLVPKGCSVAINVMALHRNPDSFKDPMVVDPDRFAPGMEERHPYAYIPFSSGQRTCVGRPHGMLMAKTVLSTFLRKFRFFPGRELNSVADIKFSYSFMLHVRGNFVRVVSLNGNSF